MSEHVMSDEDKAFEQVFGESGADQSAADREPEAPAGTADEAQSEEARGPAPDPQTPDEPPTEAAPEPEGEGDQRGENEQDQSDAQRQAQMEATTLGRLKAEQRRAADLQARLAETEKRLREMERPAPVERRMETTPPPAVPVNAVPEDLREDFADFQARYPTLAPYVAAGDQAGEQLRQALRESGPHVAAALAIPVHERVVRDNQDQMRFLSTVGSRHPEVLGFLDPTRTGEAARFRAEVQDWIESTFTAKEAGPKLALLDRNDDQGVIALLDTFKAARAGTPGTQPGQAPSPPQSAQRERDALAASAVRSRPAMPRTEKPAEKDADQAFEEVFLEGQS